MIYYSTQHDAWSDRLPTAIASAMRKKFAQWGEDQARYILHGWTPVTESSPVYDGSPLTGQRVRTLDAGGNTFSWMVGEVRWNQAIDTASQIETLRSAKLQQLHAWWDDHPGIEIAPGIVLPIQESGRNTNTAALTLALITQADPIQLVDVNDYTVELAASTAPAALATFRSAYNPISQHWDTTHKALIAATTLEALNAINLTYTPPQ